MPTFIKALKLFTFLFCLTGLIYPLLITGLSQLVMPKRASGDFIEINGKKVGALLIGQKFESNRYFWPRPSAIDYNPLSSGGSNLAPTSTQLRKIVFEREQFILKAHGLKEPLLIPSEMVFASGSGLDPHIQPSTAIFQLDRVAKARKFNTHEKQSLENLIQELSHERLLGFLGRPYINVLELNSQLDLLEKKFSHEQSTNDKK